MVEQYGVGCAGINGVPVLDAIGAPTLGNATFGLELTNGAPNAFVTFLAEFNAASLPYGPCTLLVNPPGVAISSMTDATGTATRTLPIPNGPYLGVQFVFQGLVLDLAGAYQNLAAASNSLRIVLGQ